MHRIRVGLTGLACVFLLVMISAVILRFAGDGNTTNQSTPVNAAEAPNEPLATLGVAPGSLPQDEAEPANQSRPR